MALEEQEQVEESTIHKETSLPQHVSTEPFQEALEAGLAWENKDETLASLEKAVEAFQKARLLLPTHPRPYQELTRLFRKMNRFGALAESLKQWAEQVTMPAGEKSKLILEAVYLYEQHLHQDQTALTLLQGLHQEFPENQEILNHLLAAYEKLYRFPDMIRLLQKKVSLVSSNSEKINLLERLALLFQEKFSNAAEAIKAYEHILKLSPLYQPARLYLKNQYDKRREFEKLAQLLQQEIESPDISSQEKYQLAVEQAHLYTEKVRKMELAIASWNQVLSLEPQSEKALGELEKLYEREKNWENLLVIWEQQEKLLTEPSKKLDLLQKMGILFTEKVKNEAKAISLFQQILSLDPENRKAQEALKKLYLEQKRWDELESLYEVLKKPEEFARVIERELEQKGEQADLSYRLGLLYQDKLQRPDRAIRTFEKALASQPDHERLAQALIPLYERAKEFGKLSQVLEVQLKQTPDPVLKNQRLTQLAHLKEHILKDKPAAFSLYLQAFLDQVDFSQTHELDRLAKETNDYESLAQTYERVVQENVDASVLVSLLQSLAKIYEEKLAQPTKAIEKYKKINELFPEQEMAIEPLIHLYTQTQDVSALIKAYQQKLEQTFSQEERCKILYTLADLQENQVLDLKAAQTSYEMLVAENPAEMKAWQSLSRIYQKTKNFDLLKLVLERQQELLSNDSLERKSILFQLGQVYEKNLGQKEEAFSCYQNILALDPAYPVAQQAVEQFLADPQFTQEAISLLRLVYQQTEQWEKLIPVLERQQTVISGKEQALVFAQLAAIWQEKLGQNQKAFAMYAQAIKQDPTLAPIRSKWQALARQEKEQEQVAACYLALVSENILPKDVAQTLLLEAAGLFEESNSLTHAAMAYQKAYELDPLDISILQHLERILLASQQFSKLASIYEQQEHLVSEAEQKEAILLKKALLLENQLQNKEQAIATYQSILLVNSSSQKALGAVERLLSDEKQYAELTSLYRNQLALTQNASDQIWIELKLAHVYEYSLLDLQEAFFLYEDVLKKNPTQEEALVALQRFLDKPDFEYQTACLLYPIYQKAYHTQPESKHVHLLLKIYDSYLAHCYEPTERAHWFFEKGQLLEKQDVSSAFAAYGKALAENPVKLEITSKVEQLAQQMSAFDELVSLYLQVAESAQELEVQIDLWQKAAWLEEKELGHPEKAALIWNSILQREENHGQALAALERIYTQTQNALGLLPILEKKRIWANKEEQILIQLRLAALWRHELQNEEKALELYQEVLLLEKANQTALSAIKDIFEKQSHRKELAHLLTEAYETNQDFSSLAVVYQTLLKTETDRLERSILWQKWAELIEHQKNEPTEALTLWIRAFLEDPSWEEALSQIERLAKAINDYSMVAEQLEKGLSVTQNQLVVLRVLARMYEWQLHHLEKARQAHEKILAFHGEEVDSLIALAQIAEKQRDFSSQARFLQQQLTFTLLEEQRIPLLLSIASLYTKLLAQPEKAIPFYQEILRFEPNHSVALAALEDLYLEQDNWKELLALYENKVSSVQDPKERAACYVSMALLAEEKFQEPEKAISFWNQVLALEPENMQALAALGSLYEKAEKWVEFTELLEKQAHTIQNFEEQAALYQKQATLFEEKLHDERKALRAFYQVLQKKPASLVAWRAVFRIERAQQNWKELVESYQAFLQICESMNVSQEERILAHVALAELYQNHVLDLEQAMLEWQKVQALDENHYQALFALETLFLQAQRFEEVIPLLEKQLKLHLDSTTRIEKLNLLASLWEEKLFQPAKAFPLYQQVLQLSPAEPYASKQIEKLFTNQRDFEGLSEFLLQQVEYTNQPTEKVILFQKVAILFEQELAAPSKSFWVLLAAWQEDITNQPIQNQLETLAEQTNLQIELASEYENKAKEIISSNPGRAAQLWEKASALYQSKGQLKSSITTAEQALLLSPENQNVLSLLAVGYGQLQNWKRLAEVLEKTISLEKDPKRKGELLLELAPLFEFQLENQGQAQKYYEYALDFIPEDPEVLRSLERLYQKAGNWSKLMAVLQKREEMVTDLPSLLSLLYRMADLYQEKSKDKDQAIVKYQRILELEPTQMPAILALQALYEQTEQYEAFIQMLEKQILCEENPKASLYFRLATLWETRFSRLDLASETLERLLEKIEQTHQSVPYPAEQKQAYEELARLYEKQERFEELTTLFRRQLPLLSTVTDQVKIGSKLALFYETKLLDIERAIDAYQDVLSFDQNHLPAFWALGHLYENQGDFEKAAKLWSELTQKLTSQEQKANLHLYLGVLYQEKLGLFDKAEQELVEALTLSPHDSAMIHALISLYEQQEAYIKAIQTLLYLEEQVTDRKEKANALVKIGQIYAQHLGEADQAHEMMEKALELEPSHSEALAFLQDFYYQREMWRLLAPILEQLLEQDSAPLVDQETWHYRLAKSYESLGKPQKALEHYQRAQRLAAQNKQGTAVSAFSVEGEFALAALFMKEQKWKEAEAVYQKCLEQIHAKNVPFSIAKVYHQLGLLKLAQEQMVESILLFEKAIQADPGDQDSIHALIEIFSMQQKWTEVLQLKQKLVDLHFSQAPSPDQKALILQEMGEIYQEKLHEHSSALASYEQALRVSPGHPEILQKIFTLHTQQNNWKKATETLLELAHTETLAFRQGKFYHIAATLYRDHLQATDEAMQYFNKALDSYFSVSEELGEAKLKEALKSFAALDELCTKRKDWPNQERSYRNMLKRLPPTGFESVAVMLWHALGEVYRSRLKNIPAAIQAFEVANEMDKSSIKRQEILGELYLLAGPDYLSKAFAQQQLLIQLHPMSPEPYRTLKSMYQNHGHITKDAMVYLSQILVYLGFATEEEKQEAASYPFSGLSALKYPIYDHLWTQYLYHPDEDRAISSIFAAVAPLVGLLKSEEHKQFQLKRKERQDLTKNTDIVSKTMLQVQNILQIRMPFDVYFRPDLDAGFRLANTREKDQLIPSVVVGRQILQLTQAADLLVKTTAFMTKLRAEHYLRLILPTHQELTVVLLAAIRFVIPNFTVPESYKDKVPAFESLLRPLLTANIVDHLKKIVPPLIQAGKPLLVASWLKAVDLTAYRTALLLTGDLSLVTKCIEQEIGGGAMAQESIGKLLAFAASPAYFTLRKELGLSS